MSKPESADIETLKQCLKPSDLKQYSTLRKRISEDGILTFYQQKKYDSYNEIIESYLEEKKGKDNPYIHSTKEVADFFGVSHVAFGKWLDNPTFPKNAGGGKKSGNVWNLKIVFDWYITYFMGDADMSKRMLTEKLRYQEARSLREKLEVEELQGNLVSLDNLKQDLSFIFVRMKSALLLWERRLPPLLEGKDSKSMYKVIHKETYNILNNFSKGVKALCRK